MSEDDTCRHNLLWIMGCLAYFPRVLFHLAIEAMNAPVNTRCLPSPIHLWHVALWSSIFTDFLYANLIEVNYHAIKLIDIVIRMSVRPSQITLVHDTRPQNNAVQFCVHVICVAQRIFELELKLKLKLLCWINVTVLLEHCTTTAASSLLLDIILCLVAFLSVFCAPCAAGAPFFPPCPSFPPFTFPSLSLALHIFFFCPSLPFLPE